MINKEIAQPPHSGGSELNTQLDAVIMRPMQFDDGRIGWFIDHPEFYCDIEQDTDGKWSVFFRDRKTQNKAFAEYPNAKITRQRKKDTL